MNQQRKNQYREVQQWIGNLQKLDLPGKERQAILEDLAEFAESLGLKFDPKNPEYSVLVLNQEINRRITEAFAQAAPNVPAQLIARGKEVRKSYAQHLKESEGAIWRDELDPKTQSARRRMGKSIAQILLAFLQTPKASQVAGEALVEELAVNLPQASHLSQADLDEAAEQIQPAVAQELKNFGLPESQAKKAAPTLTKQIAQKTLPQAQVLAAAPHATGQSVRKVVEKEKKRQELESSEAIEQRIQTAQAQRKLQENLKPSLGKMVGRLSHLTPASRERKITELSDEMAKIVGQEAVNEILQKGPQKFTAEEFGRLLKENWELIESRLIRKFPNQPLPSQTQIETFVKDAASNSWTSARRLAYVAPATVFGDAPAFPRTITGFFPWLKFQVIGKPLHQALKTTVVDGFYDEDVIKRLEQAVRTDLVDLNQLGFKRDSPEYGRLQIIIDQEIPKIFYSTSAAFASFQQQKIQAERIEALTEAHQRLKKEFGADHAYARTLETKLHAVSHQPQVAAAIQSFAEVQTTQTELVARLEKTRAALISAGLPSTNSTVAKLVTEINRVHKISPEEFLENSFLWREKTERLIKESYQTEIPVLEKRLPTSQPVARAKQEISTMIGQPTPPSETEKRFQEHQVMEKIINEGWTVRKVDQYLNKLQELGPIPQGLKDFQSLLFKIQTIEKEGGRLANKPFTQVVENYFQFQEGLPSLSDLGPLKRALPAQYRAPFDKIIRFRQELSSWAVRKLTRDRFASIAHLNRFIYQKTIGRIVSAFVKSGVGKAIKAGAKKVAVKAAAWLATRLGVEAGILAAGTAVGGPVGAAIAVVINVIVEVALKIIKKVWDKIKSFIQNIKRDPIKMAFYVIAGLAVFFFFPSPFRLLGLLPIFIGVAALISWGLVGAGATLATVGGGVVNFFTALATSPVTFLPGYLIISIIGGLILMTFFIVMTTAGAFILPIEPGAGGDVFAGYPPPEEVPAVPPPAGLSFSWPVPGHRSCTSNFGYRILEGECDFHEGIDIPAKTKTKVYATADGTVAAAGSERGYGKYVVVKHNGLYSLYAHLWGHAVKVGDTISSGSLVGYVGSTGFSSGPHLHFGFSTCPEEDFPTCFKNGDLTPNPCADGFLNCPSGCGYRDETRGCSN